MVFNIFKKRKHERIAANRIGVELHRQISSAFNENEEETGVRLTSFFTAGYIYGFIRLGFAHQGIKGGRASEKYIRTICDGVLPGRLYESFQRILAATEIVKEAENKREVENFEKGIEVGASDSKYFSVFLAGDDEELNDIFKGMANVKEPNNLCLYLIGREKGMEYMPVE